MCGIAGSFTAAVYNDDSQRIVNAILQHQQPRGPDHQAIERIVTLNASVVFGHNRLSIVDLAATANQPMWDYSGRYCITYNGEIYNYLELRIELIKSGYRFLTQSDTEVILNAFAAWGVAALARFNGAFAFALFDKQSEQLWLVRDRFGKKPLYYIWRQNVLYFASTLSVFAKQFNLKPNLHYLANGLHYWVYEDGTTITPYEQLAEVPAANYLQISLQNGKADSQLTRYYDLSSRVLSLQTSLEKTALPELLTLLTHQLESAVELRLQADAPIGVTLSGGLDSSTVAALASKRHSEIIGFSFGHPQERSTEGPLVAEIAKQINLPVNYVWPSEKEMAQAVFKVMQLQEAPYASASVIAQYFVYQGAHAAGIKILLGGQGGDEAFMGYRKFHLFKLQQLIKQRRYAEAGVFLWQLLPLLFAEIKQVGRYWQHRVRYQHSASMTSTLNLPAASSVQLTLNAEEPLWRRQLLDVTRYSLPTLLRYEDRNSLGNSVESRLPFLDYRIIELGLALPELLKIHQGYGKWGIRQIVHGKIPESIRMARYKRGFDVVIERLLSGGLGKIIRDALHENQALVKDFLQPGVVIDKNFSDRQFIQRQATFAEAMTLIWLTGRYSL